MVLMSHDFVPDGSVIRSQNQNGSCSSNGASVLHLKWKPRSVSAVRDFPRGCGPIVQPVNVDSEEANPSSSPVSNNNRSNDTVTAVTEVESLPHAVSDPTEDVNVELIDNQSILKDEISAPVIEESTRKMQFPQRRVSAVREFPPYCGLNATEPSKEERIRINGKRSSGIEGKSDGKIERSSESNASVKDEIPQKTQSNKSNESLTENQQPMGDERSTEKESNTASQIIEKVCQELVVYKRDSDKNKRSSIDAYDEDSEENLEDDKIHGSKAQAVMPIRSFSPNEKKVKKVKKASHKKEPKRALDDINSPIYVKGDRILVLGLTAPSFSPKVIPSITPKESKSKPKSKSKKVKVSKESNAEGNETNTGQLSLSPKAMPSITPKESKSKSKSKSKPKKVKVSKESNSIGDETNTGQLDMVVRNDQDLVQETEKQDEVPNPNPNPNSHGVDVALPPFGPRSSNSARNRIRETLRLFQALCRKLLQGEEAKVSEDDESKHVLTGKRVDLTAKAILEAKGKAPDRGEKTYGPIPGIEVGDEFQYRVELALIGLHGPLQPGIDYIKHGKKKDPVAISVVASGGYDNEIDKPDCLIYSGAGGVGKDKNVHDQKLERGNIALKNNIDLKIPVRVVRGYKGKSAEPSSRTLPTTYIYDGLYTVERYWQEKGPHGNLVFKFELQRIPGQPELALREVKSKNFKAHEREGLCVPDITNGKEPMRIPAVNTINDEKPPVFNYITKIVYPDWYRPAPPTGCDCAGRCSGKRCACAAKNGGEIPYNHNGAIVEAKPLVYECGPACKCGPTCYNRVTQNGMKIQLEIFKTETRGWGVRSLSSISSGSFICEYVGELLEDTEAEKRTTNDEYLFDIGQNYNDCSLDSDLKLKVDSGGGFTIDAANYGNVGRFINHSCSPNLYAQNVLYDQEDKRMPHIMFFAAENIPPLKELTYHYNYAVDTVHDSEGNIKVKKCYCGSSECTGRLY